MKKWKEVLEKNYKIVQACGCICLIGVLGFGIYSLQKESIPAKETEVVVTEKKQEKSTTQKAEKKDTDQSKKQEIKSAKAEIKKVEKETGKNPAAVSFPATRSTVFRIMCSGPGHPIIKCSIFSQLPTQIPLNRISSCPRKSPVPFTWIYSFIFTLLLYLST